jgi:hypothetical protein
MRIRDFVPPIAIAVARRLFAPPRDGSNDATRKQYATYGEALADCTERGYENVDIVNVVLEKTKRYRVVSCRKRNLSISVLQVHIASVPSLDPSIRKKST